jgi:hypothetical protein
MEVIMESDFCEINCGEVHQVGCPKNVPLPKGKWASDSREAGFHEGIEFAITSIENALQRNPDIPFIVLEKVKEVLLKKSAAPGGQGD